MRMFVKPRILSQSKYTMKNRQSRFVFSILRSFRAHLWLAKLRGSETQTMCLLWRNGSLPRRLDFMLSFGIRRSGAKTIQP